MIPLALKRLPVFALQHLATAAPKMSAVFPVVVPELELGNVQRQIFSGNLVIGAHDAAFNQRPETVNGLGVNSADNVFATGMPYHLMRVVFVQPQVAPVFVGGSKSTLVLTASRTKR